MTRQLEAVFEHGVLRPLEPLSLPESQRVLVTITDVPASPAYNPRQIEQEWLNEHEHEYRGEWVALDGNVLLSHGSDAVAVRDAARRKTNQIPLFVRIPEEPELPSAGWL
jgi:predicted DNA-binding antitoxin AbrB/MazE fold protein